MAAAVSMLLINYNWLLSAERGVTNAKSGSDSKGLFGSQQ